MHTYELLLSLPGTLDDAQAQARLEELTKVVEERGAEVRVNSLGKNRLAYPVKQIRYGYFYTLIFKAEPEAVRVLQEKLALTRDVLRAMVSRFNVDLNASQKHAYGMSPVYHSSKDEHTQERHIAPAARLPEKSLQEKVTDLVTEETAPSAVKSTAERKLDDADLAAITKKLDDLMEGDVIPGI